MNLHSPGPWDTDSDQDSGDWIVRDATGCRVATGIHFLVAQHDANARLIAAAPDLLAACKRGLDDLVQFIELAGTGNPETYEAVAQLRAAINKAESQ
jgi:hypothetical protein